MYTTAPPKVLMRIPVSPNSGYGNDGIQFTMALLKAGMDVRLYPTTIAPPVPPAIAHLLTKPLDAPFDLYINHVSPDQLECSSQARVASAITVAHTMWEFCVDEETEIFTKRGWLKYTELEVGDTTLGLNSEDGKSYWTEVTDIFISQIKTRKMLAVESQTHSSLTTLSHRWLVKTNQNKWAWTTSENLNTNHHIPRSAPRADNPEVPTYSDEFVELVAWTYTEGWLERGKSIRIGQNSIINPEETERIRTALTALWGSAVKRNNPNGGLTWSESKKSDGMIVFNVSRQSSVAILKVCPEKVPSLEFINSLTQRQLELFIDVSVLADGSHTLENASRFTFFQNAGGRLEAFLFACTLAGYTISVPRRTGRAGTVREVPKGTVVSNCDHYRVRGLTTPAFITPIQSSGKDQFAKLVEHTGRVWCPTVRLGNWLARRRGSVFFTGNSSMDNLRGRSSLKKRLKDFDLFLGYSDTTLKAVGPHLPASTAFSMLQGGYDPSHWPYMERDWNSPRFSFIMHGTLNLRKDPHIAIQAYVELKDEYPEEFEPAEMRIHTLEPGLPKIMETVIPKLRIHYETWPEETVRQFYQSGHVLISPSHGEGKNLPCLEMLSTGGSVIATSFSGHLNWLSDSYAYPLNCTVVPVDRARYGEECRWAAADKDHLKALMLHAFRNRQEVKRKGELGSQIIPDMCSWDKVVQDLFRIIGDKLPEKGRDLQMRFDMIQRERSDTR